VSRWLAILPLVVLAALAALFAGYALHHDPHVNPAALVGRPVPAEQLPGLEDGTAKPLWAAGRGPVLINFYASTCAPCVEEAPALMALKAQGVQIIGVAWKDEPDKAQAFLQRYGDPFAAKYVDQSGRAGVDFGITGVPETFAVDASGVIRAKYISPLTPDSAEALIDRAGLRP
jgi:cytochrome c biogenesis protein CcmG/thiol:disulfide interchange protein DsbE